METLLKNYNYIEKGEGQVIILLHGLMGGLSNFKDVIDFFSTKNYKVVIPELPIYTLPLKETSVTVFSRCIKLCKTEYKTVLD